MFPLLPLFTTIFSGEFCTLASVAIAVLGAFLMPGSIGLTPGAQSYLEMECVRLLTSNGLLTYMPYIAMAVFLLYTVMLTFVAFSAVNAAMLCFD